ncbi:MAG: ATP-binding protein, partial [Myxococcota bacterium]|nr:ATP-binding protein [Myxococcota bacterium]
ASGGTGIGLANVKQIVDEWGGRITTRSVLGDGTTFRIEVPCSVQVEGSKRV